MATTAERLASLEGAVAGIRLSTRITKAEAALLALSARITGLETDVTQLQVLMGEIGGPASPFVYVTAELAAALASGPGPGVIVSPSLTGLPVLHGFGRYALDGLPATEYIVSSLAGTTDAGTFRGAVAWINAGNKGTVRFTVDGTIPLPNGNTSINSKSNFMFDGRGRSITLTGGPVVLNGECHHYAFVNLRHAGGFDGGQNADNFTNYGGSNPATLGCHDYAFVNVSARGSYDEGISSTEGCWNYTLEDCLFGAGDPNHDYGSLQYGGYHNWNGSRPGVTGTGGSFIRNAFIGKAERNPKLSYRGDAANGSPNPNLPDPNPYTYDVINNITVNCSPYSMTVEQGCKTTNVNPYQSGNRNNVVVQTGAVISNSLPIPSFAREGITILSPTAARDNARVNAGCLPHDAFDTTLLSAL